MKIPKIWRIIDTGCGTAVWNMAVDEMLLNRFDETKMPILRVYGWEPSLSLGRFSKLHKGINVQKLKEQNIPVVRRLSGGGVLVHGGDLSYTLILPREVVKEIGVKESYRTLCKFLLHLYEKLSLQASFASDGEYETKRSDVCLAGNEAYDIVIDGDKMGGNAQRYTKGALLQHGTIPMRINTKLFTPLFVGDSGLERAATLERLGVTIEYEKLSFEVQESFCEAFDVTLFVDTLTKAEERCVQELLQSRYTQERWNYHGQTF